MSNKESKCSNFPCHNQIIIIIILISQQQLSKKQRNNISYVIRNNKNLKKKRKKKTCHLNPFCTSDCIKVVKTLEHVSMSV